MDQRSAVRLTLRIAGAIFGLMFGLAMAWTSIFVSIFDLRGVPIDAASFGLSDTLLIAATTILGATLGGFLVGYFWESVWGGLLSGALATSAIKTSGAYLTTVGSLAGNDMAEIILFHLPLGLIFGGLLWLLLGLLGSAIERLVLSRAASMFAQGGRSIPLAWLLVLAAGILIGSMAGGTSPERDSSVAAARAIHYAIQSTNGGESLQQPPGFFVSKPAISTLQSLGPRLKQSYLIYLGENDGYEVVIDTRFQDELWVRCVSQGARISRCFEQ